MSLYTIEGNVKAIGDNILASSMDFGEVKSADGIIINSDDGKSHGVKARWCKVYDKGPDQDMVNVGDWILVEHGRWTRKIKVQIDDKIIELQKIDPNGVLAFWEGKGDPDQNYIGQEYGDGESFTVNPEDFM